MEEIWKPVPGYEGKYEVSDQGRVRSFVRNANGRILKQTKNVSGHLYVLLGRKVNVTVHTLVLKAFVSDRPTGCECCHNDGNPSNNRLANLRWDTHKENIRDIFKHASSPKQKLTPAQVKHIKQTLSQNCARGVMTTLANQYKVSLGAITHIKKGRTYAYIVA